MSLKSKKEIVTNWLPRYTGEELKNFGSHILLCNFLDYVERFAEKNKVPVKGADHPMQCATSGGVTIINFGMGSASAATIMDLLSAMHPRGVLFLGKCGGLIRGSHVGGLILPIAAVRGAVSAQVDLRPDVP